MEDSDQVVGEALDYSKSALSRLTNHEIEVLEKVLQAIRQIKFGYVQITIQDAQVVQIERTEKQRLNRK
jgi:hypothetical protein